jgi:hypothetical protein
MSTKVLDYSGNGDYANHAAANAWLAAGPGRTLLVRRLTTIPVGFKPDAYLATGTQDDITIDSEDGALVDLMMFHDLTPATWTNHSGDIWYTELGTTDHKNCLIFAPDLEWSNGSGCETFMFFTPLRGASIAAVAASLTLGKSWIDNATGRLYINRGGDPNGLGYFRTVNIGNQTSWNYAMGLVTQSGRRLTVRNIRVGGVGLFDPAAASDGAAVSSMGAWAMGGALADGASIEDCEAWHGSNHAAGWTNIDANAVVAIDIRCEQMIPASTSGTLVFTTGGGAGSTVNLTYRCDKGAAAYGSADGAVIAAGAGSALLIHDALSQDFAAFNLIDSTLAGGQFQVNDDNGPITVTGSTLLDLVVGSVGAITSGVTLGGCTLNNGLPTCTNATDVVTCSGCTIYWKAQKAIKGVQTVSGCTIDLSTTTISAGARFGITGGYAANLLLTLTDNHIIGAGVTWGSFLYQARANNIVAWNRNKWTGFNVWLALEAFDSDNNDVSNGNFVNPEEPSAAGDTAAECIQSLGYDLDNHTSERNASQARLRNLVPAAMFPLNEPAGFLCRDVMATTAGKYLFKTSGAGMVRDGDSLYVNTAGLGNTRVGSTRAMITPPVAGVWRWSVFFDLKAGTNDGRYVFSQRNSGRSGDYFLICSGTGAMPTANLGLYIADGTVRMGGATSHYPVVYNDSAWHQYVVVVSDKGDGATFSAKWWKDGLFVAETPACNLPTNFGTGTTIWVGGDIADPTFTGYIKTFAIWNRALTPAEAIVACGKSRRLRRKRHG